MASGKNILGSRVPCVNFFSERFTSFLIDSFGAERSWSKQGRAPQLMITWTEHEEKAKTWRGTKKRKSTNKPPEFGCRRQWQCCQLPWEQQKPHSERERNEHNCTPSQFHLPADYSSKAQQFCGTLRCQSLPGSCHWDLNKRVCISWDPYETNQNIVFWSLR